MVSLHKETYLTIYLACRGSRHSSNYFHGPRTRRVVDEEGGAQITGHVTASGTQSLVLPT